MSLKLDGVIHLMGENLAEHRWTEEFKERLDESRVGSTQHLLRAFQIAGLDAKLKFWIQGSAVGYYGCADLNQPVDEGSVTGKGFLPELCLAWERAIEPLPPSVRRVILRTGVVMSHRGGAFVKMVGPILQGVGGNLGKGDQALSLIHLQDLVRFVVYAAQADSVRGVFNLVCHEPISQRLLNEKLCRRLYVKPGLSAPAWILKALFGEMSSLLLDSLAVRSSRLGAVGFKLDYPDVDSVVNEVTSWHQHPEVTAESTWIKFSEQFVPMEMASLFKFFSEAKNLERLTPEFLNFKIVAMSTHEISEGTRIRYRLQLHGVPFEWLTDIRHWDPPRRFVDVQAKGPYSLWYHEHVFYPIPGGTIIQDWVRYRLPLGRLGRWAGSFKVKGDIDRIFAYRRETIGKVDFQAPGA